jgi:hypothetical protein
MMLCPRCKVEMEYRTFKFEINNVVLNNYYLCHKCHDSSKDIAYCFAFVNKNDIYTYISPKDNWVYYGKVPTKAFIFR